MNRVTVWHKIDQNQQETFECEAPVSVNDTGTLIITDTAGTIHAFNRNDWRRVKEEKVS